MDFLTAEVSIRANIEKLKGDLEAAKRAVYKATDELSARAAKEDPLKLAKRAALIEQRSLKDQMRAETDLLKSLKQREAQNNKIAREHRRAVNEMCRDLERFSREAFMAGAAISAGFGLAIKKYADAERYIRQALANVDQPDENAFQAIYAGAEDLAIRFNMSFQQIGRSLDVLKRSRIETEQQLKMMTPLLALAKGGMTDAGIVTEKLLSIMTGFNIPMNNLVDVVNVLAYASVKSRGTLSDMMDSLIQLAPVAEMSGNSLLMMVAASMYMRDAGIQGTQGAMAMRRTLFNLMNAASKATKTVGEHIDIYDPWEKRLKTIPELFDDLNVAMEGVDEQTKKAIISHLFEQRAISGGVAVLRAGGKGLMDYVNKLGNCGDAVQALVDSQLRAFAEQLGILGQQIQALVRRIGAALVPAITKINNALRPYLRALMEWMDTNPKITQGIVTTATTIGLITAALGAVGLGIRSTVFILKPLVTMCRAVGAAGLAAFGWWPVVILGAVAAVYVFRAAVKANFKGIGDAWKTLLDILKSGIDWIANAFTQAAKWIGDTMGPAFKNVGVEFKEFGKNLVGLHYAMKAWPKKGESFGETLAKEFLRGREEAEKWGKSVSAGAAKVGEGVKEAWNLAGPVLKEFGKDVWGDVKELSGIVVDQFKKDLGSLTDYLAKKFPQYADMVNKYKNLMDEAIDETINFGQTPPPSPGRSLANWERGIQKYYDSIKEWNNFVTESVADATSRIEGAFADAFAKIGDEGQGLKETMLEMVRAVGTEIRQMLGQIATRALMKSTVEVLFPQLAGLSGSGGQLTMAGSALQTAGSILNTSGAVLNQAASMLMTAASMQMAGGTSSSSSQLTQALIKAGASSFSGFGGGAGGMVGGGGGSGFTEPTPVGGLYAHRGGIVGGNLFPNQIFAAGLFANARRYHNGLKLQSDEYPAILQRGEEVVPRDKVGKQSPIVNDNRLRIVNLMDQSLIRDYLRSSEGEKVVINIMKRNPYVR